MGPDLWIQGAVLGLALTQLVVFWYLYRQFRRSETPSASPADERTGNTCGAQVTCPDCGTVNGAGFDFCQSCVSELPGRSVPPGTPGSPQGRGMS